MDYVLVDTCQAHLYSYLIRKVIVKIYEVLHITLLVITSIAGTEVLLQLKSPLLGHYLHNTHEIC